MKIAALYKRFAHAPLPARYFTLLLAASSLLCLPFMVSGLMAGSGPGCPVWVYLLVLTTPFIGVLYGFSKEKAPQHYTPSQKYSVIFMAAGTLVISPILAAGIAWDRPAVGWTVVIPFVTLFLGSGYGSILSKRPLEKEQSRE